MEGRECGRKQTAVFFFSKREKREKEAVEEARDANEGRRKSCVSGDKTSGDNAALKDSHIVNLLLAFRKVLSHQDAFYLAGPFGSS